MTQILIFKNKIRLTAFSLLLTLSTFAQTVTIGTGTATSNATNITPYKTLWEDGRSQLLILASELNSAGAPSGGIITNLAFNVTAINAQVLNGFTVRIGHTTLTALTNAFQPNGTFTTCFTGNIGATSVGWNTYTFTNQFTWNGASNIIVEVCFDNAAWNGNSTVQVSTTTFNSNTSANADLATGCTLTGTSVGTTRPNIRMNFIPSTPCTAPPSGGTATAAVTNPCPAEPASISVTGGTIGTGATYQWQSSPNNITWSNITTGGTNPFYSGTVSTPTFFRRQVTCSTQTATSTSVLITPRSFIQCYCTAGASSAFDSDIGKVKFSLGCTTILENGFDSPATNNANATGTYTSFINTVPPARFVKGLAHDAELYYVSRGGYFQSHFNVFIDLNKNGIFEANERLANVAGVNAGANGKAGAARVTLTIPVTADTGFTGMRIYMQEGGSAASGPCGTFTWGEVEDYMVRIVNAPDMQITSVVSPVNNSCGTDQSRVIVTVRNNSATDTSFFNTARAVITGALNTTLNGSMCRMLLPGQSDTIQFPVTINTIAGGTYNIRTFPNIISDPNFNNDTTNVNITISPLPNNPTVVKSSQFNGTFDQGTLAQPDYVASNDTIVYELTAPVGFTNAQYGSAWLADVTVKSFTGTNISNFTLFPPSGSDNAKVRIVPNSNEVDSIYEMVTRFYFTPSNCDTLVKRVIYIAPRPVSKFGNSISCFGTPTQFTDSSTLVRGTISYEWDFGDAGNADTSTAQNPQYLFSASGNYTVTLTTTSNLGYKNTVTKQISVGYTPVPSFSFTNQCDGNPFNFKNNTTIGGSQTTMTYVWNFLNDNTIATTTDASKLYAGVGNYDVRLTAKSVLNCEASITRTVNVFPVPDADFSSSTACTDKNTIFTNTSTVQYGDLGYYWSFGNGTNSTDKNPSASFATIGNRSVKLVVTTEFGCIDSVTKTVTVGQTPVTDFSVQNNCSADSVTFVNNTTGSGVINSNWNFGDGNVTANNASVVKNKYNAGSYNVRLTATSGNCSSEATKTIVVNSSPEADFTTNGNACLGSATQFTNISSGNSISNVWSFGVGSSSSTLKDPTFTYATAGSYNVKLVVTSDKGCADSIIQQVVVYALPNSSFSKVFNTAPTQNLQRQRQVSLTPADSNYFSYFWTMGDGTNYQQVKPTHNYLQDGKYYITLKVIDNRGCENSFLDSVIFNLSSTTDLSSNNSVSVFPNPFKNSTNVSFVLAQQSMVSVVVYDMLGRELKTLHNGSTTSGLHQIEFNTNELSTKSAGYIIRVMIDGKSYTKQVIEIK